LFDGNVGLFSDLKLLRLLVWSGKGEGMEAGASLLPEAIASFTRSGGYSDLSDRIAQVTHPTLILWGKADDVLGTADATRWQRAIADSQLIWRGSGTCAPLRSTPSRCKAPAILHATY